MVDQAANAAASIATRLENDENLLEIRDLHMYFPIRQGFFSQVSGLRQGGRWRVVRHQARRDAGAGRRKRLRQIDDWALHRARLRNHRRADALPP